MVSRETASPAELADLKIAVPGTLTSAFLALRIFNPKFSYEVVPFDQVIEAVENGACDAGLLIHEGQLFYESLGLHKILDLGEWWHQQTGLPLPMGGNAIRRDLAPEVMRQVSQSLKESIRYALDHREDALQYAMQFAREMDSELADRFVAMWVNDLTLEYTDRGREAVRRLLSEGDRHPRDVRDLWNAGVCAVILRAALPSRSGKITAHIVGKMAFRKLPPMSLIWRPPVVERHSSAA